MPSPNSSWRSGERPSSSLRDGYDLTIKKLRKAYHNPIGLATALLNASKTEKRPPIH